MADPTIPAHPIETAMYVSLDRSGSMESCRDLITTGLNDFIEKMQSDQSARGAQFLLTQWDSQGFDIIRRGALADVSPLTKVEFTPRALTPLLDATAFATEQLKLANARRKVLVIVTDGQENASRKWKLPQLKDYLRHLQSPAGGGWIIIYLAAHVDAWEQAEGMGIPKERAMNFKAGEAQVAPTGRVAKWFGRSRTVNPFSIAMLAAGGLAAAYVLMRPDQADAALTPLGFTDAQRNDAMGVDGITTTWQQAVKEDVQSFNEPFKGLLDLPEDLRQIEATLPKDFDPCLGSLDEDGEQPGQPEGEVLSDDDYCAVTDDDDDDEDGDSDADADTDTRLADLGHPKDRVPDDDRPTPASRWDSVDDEPVHKTTYSPPPSPPERSYDPPSRTDYSSGGGSDSSSSSSSSSDSGGSSGGSD